MILKKDILDELELKNKENLSSNRFNNNSAMTMSREMETLKINDDAKNEEFIKNANEEAYEYNSDDAVICDNYGLYLMRKNNYDEALKVYEKALESERNFPEIYYNYALVLIEKGEKEKARENLEKALEKPFFNNTTVKKEAVEAAISDL